MKMREPDLLWEAALTACYGDKPNLTASERGRMNKALKELREIGATPEDIIARAKHYPKVMPPGCVITISALVANWSRCKPPAVQKRGTASYHELYVSPDWMRK